MRHYAGSVPKPQIKEEKPLHDISSIKKLPGTHVLPPIMEIRNASAEKLAKMQFERLEERREELLN